MFSSYKSIHLIIQEYYASAGSALKMSIQKQEKKKEGKTKIKGLEERKISFSTEYSSS